MDTSRPDVMIHANINIKKQQTNGFVQKRAATNPFEKKSISKSSESSITKKSGHRGRHRIAELDPVLG